MIGLGIDAVEIERFKAWTTFSHAKLSRVFTREELGYCFAVPTKTAERLAVRFAAKEAFYKAVFPLLEHPLPLLYIFKHCEVVKEQHGMPVFQANWTALSLKNAYKTTLSVTHTRLTAIAVVVIENL